MCQQQFYSHNLLKIIITMVEAQVKLRQRNFCMPEFHLTFEVTPYPFWENICKVFMTASLNKCQIYVNVQCLVINNMVPRFVCRWGEIQQTKKKHTKKKNWMELSFIEPNFVRKLIKLSVRLYSPTIIWFHKSTLTSISKRHQIPFLRCKAD